MTQQDAPLAAAAIAHLEAEGVDAVIGTVVNPAGLTQAKAVPLRRTNTFADPGLGASPVWHGFAIDQTGIAFTDDIGVVGDQRIRIDLAALRIVGAGLAWAPGGFYEQDGTPVPACSRGTLRRVEAALAEAGIEAMVGHEIEFVLVNPDGSRLPSTLWAQYGLAGALEYEDFVRDFLPPPPVPGSLSSRSIPNTGSINSKSRLPRKHRWSPPTSWCWRGSSSGGSPAGTGYGSACHRRRSPTVSDPVPISTSR